MSDARIDRLEQEVRSLRRALYGMAALSLALGSVAIASCAKSTPPPTKLVFTDGQGAETTIDASGLQVKDAEHLVFVRGGTVSADHVQVMTHGKDTGGSMELAPDQLSLHTAASLVTLYVSQQTGARIQMSSADAHADITTLNDIAGFTLRTPHGKLSLETSKDQTFVNNEYHLTARSGLSAGPDEACVSAERRRGADEKRLPSDSWETCAPPAKK